MKTKRNQIIRASVRTMYDMQKLRIAIGNRIVAAFRIKLGIESNVPVEEDSEADELLKEIRAEFSRITDGIKRVTTQIKIESPLITSFGELMLIESYERQLDAESVHERAIASELINEPIWNEFLQGIRGVGPLMAGVIVSEIDISACNSISALWAYAGLDTVTTINEDGEEVTEGSSRKKHHLVEREYTNRKGEVTKAMSITFNPLLKTKMVGVLAGVFMRLGGEYKEIYDGYKFRLQHRPDWKDRSKLHIDRAAKRYMIKMFLADLWTARRTIEGSAVCVTYQEENLDVTHHKKVA